MKRAVVFAMTCAVFFLPSWSISGKAQSAEEQQCKLVVEAIEAANRLKPGMTRADVEEDFKEDGGISFPPQARYIYRKCSHIKIDVEFSGEPMKLAQAPSPNDRITKVSRAYLEYPSFD